ncbi:hypothetical protein [Methylobacterium sp. J-076]|uniref:DUF7946 domain-containing protein n=1 Tax=Methylobacterium sp. J-076 TaxID=2836655 RepID=UPI001FB8AB7D|nr:hypothetical protein [Methylobacterium sp. J-076]MCJ2012168.1 hypothetical protein [Methylobacterium sp. J-076]
MSDEHQIDFYDISEALHGFQRYLALTTNLVVNNEIITHSTALKNARIYALPPEEGSWKILAPIVVACTAAYHVGTADKDTPIGNLAHSIYAYVIQESLGINPDFDKDLGQQIKDERAKNPNFPELTQSKIDSLIEKCHNSLQKIHRPIIASETAKQAEILFDDGSGEIKTTGSFDRKTYDYMAYDKEDSHETIVIGRITSYNVNTFKGRIYIPKEKRPIPFMLADNARRSDIIDLVTSSLSASALDIVTSNDLRCFVYKTKSRTDRLKFLVMTNVTVVP